MIVIKGTFKLVPRGFSQILFLGLIKPLETFVWIVLRRFVLLGFVSEKKN
jgi:hypothetical protein